MEFTIRPERGDRPAHTGLPFLTGMRTSTHVHEVTSPASGRRRALPDWLNPGEPHLYRGPFTRWPHISDAVLTVLVFVGSVIAVTVSALGDGDDLTINSIADRPAGSILLLGIAATALMWRRQRAIGVAVFLMALMLAWAFAGYGDGQDLALVVALWTVGRYAADHGRSLATVGAAIAVGMLATIVDANQRIDVAPAIILGWLPWYLGMQVRNRGDFLALLQERAERLEAEQHQRAREAVAEERTRIARELHDVVAHQVSMMTVHAGAAKTIARSDIDSAVEAMGDVENAGRQALGELRHLLGVLRPEGPDIAADVELGPQPGFADISTLADELTHTGADVTLSVEPMPPGLSAAVSLSAYRIIQESITNIIKHAGPNPAVEIDLSLDETGLVISVINSTDDSVAPGLPGSGYGIAGMRERAALLGGSLTAEKLSPVRFCVVARLPLHTERI